MTKTLSLGEHALSPLQAARALRQALSVFAREGVGGLSQAGFDGGLAGFIAKAGTQTNRYRQAIRSKLFSMAFQPVVSLDGRVVHHYEALIRPEVIEGCRYTGPQDFVEQVEALGLADELDLAVAASVCAAAGRARHRVAFNLSGQSAQNAPLRKRLLEDLAASSACAQGLVLVEMTETADIDDLDEAARTVEALRALRIPFCLDDFGAGAADIRVLRALQVDYVKLDGQYIAGAERAGPERAFVAAMVEMGRAAGAVLIAERVETAEEAAAMAELGVQYGQGWLFGRPGGLPVLSGQVSARRRGKIESWG